MEQKRVNLEEVSTLFKQNNYSHLTENERYSCSEIEMGS